MNPAEIPLGGGVYRCNHLAGPDRSTGKDNLIFGTRVMSEGTPQELFCPTVLPAEVKRRLADQVMDAVAQPGGNLMTDGESGVVGLIPKLCKTLQGKDNWPWVATRLHHTATQNAPPSGKCDLWTY
jgi:hypothetical protein